MVNKRAMLLVVVLVLVLGAAALLVFSVLAVPLRKAGLLPPPSLEVTYINVGYLGSDQAGVVGDSILIRSSEGKVALIDGGFPNGFALAYLKAHQVTHLDLVVLTHPHDDHSGGLVDILKTIPADLFVSNGQPLDSPVYADLQAVLQDRKIKTRVVRSDDELPFGSLTFHVHSPREINPDSINNGSVVLRLIDGQVAFLFTGDTQKLEEDRLVHSGDPLRADILKLAHHGADTSSLPAFIAKVKPAVAIYSVGAGNKYDFPHQVTLDTLHKAGAVIYGTDVNGTIVVTTDGKTYQVIPERDEGW
jgi:competence protein ComEC